MATMTSVARAVEMGATQHLSQVLLHSTAINNCAPCVLLTFTYSTAVGEPCNLPGCKKPKYVDPANGRVHDYCGRTHANQAQAAGKFKIMIVLLGGSPGITPTCCYCDNSGV